MFNDPSEYYDTGFGKRLALVFNHESFDPRDDSLPFQICPNNLKSIDDFLLQMDFEVHAYEDMTFSDMKETLRRNMKNHSGDVSVLAIVICTLVREERIYAKDKYYTLDDLINALLLGCFRTFLHIPKLIFIQESHTTKWTGKHEPKDLEGPKEPLNNRSLSSKRRVPTAADFLFVNSMFPCICDIHKRAGFQMGPYEDNLDIVNMLSCLRGKLSSEGLGKGFFIASSLTRKLCFSKSPWRVCVNLKRNPEKYYRSKAIILNHAHFDDPSLNPRTGTEFDVKTLKETFSRFSFEYEVKDDLSLNELSEFLSHISSKDLSSIEMLVVVVLSHGDRGKMYAKDEEYDLEHIWSFFTTDACPSLAGKPKIFLFQGCQGIKVDHGFIELQALTISKPLGLQVPPDPNFLIVLASFPGFISYRHKEQGSLFIQALCKSLENIYEQDDVNSVMTRMNQMLSQDHGCRLGMQVGFLISTLNYPIPIRPFFSLTRNDEEINYLRKLIYDKLI